MSRRNLATLYFAFAVIGAIAPYAILIPWAQTHGFHPTIFFALPFATAPAALFSTDLLIGATVFLIFATVEGGRVGVPRWIVPAATVIFGLCCAMPLFLALRERALEKRRG